MLGTSNTGIYRQNISLKSTANSLWLQRRVRTNWEDGMGSLRTLVVRCSENVDK
jgi:hypothetical protein